MTPRLLTALVAIFALCGCQPRDPASTPPAKFPVATSSAVGTLEAPREVRIEAGDNMKFVPDRLEAAPGETLRVTLVNTGRAPKEAMGHNWVLLRSGTDVVAFANAAIRATKSDYVPSELSASILAHTRMLGGGAKDTITFTVPPDSAPGTQMTFLCTFPAHLQLGMKGILVVR